MIRKSQIRKSAYNLLPFVMVLATSLTLLTISIHAQNNLSVASTDKKQKLINRFPKKLPRKVEVENAESEDLLNVVKIKLTNQSEKPIYYLKFALFMHGVRSPEGKRTGFPLGYGRAELVGFGEMARPNDVPINPNETHTFVVDGSFISNWRKAQKAKNIPEPRLFVLEFHHLSFGDGTGFFGPSGKSFSIEENKAKNRHSMKKKLAF